jgi:phosphoglycerate dehydrogenase-like enzyme
MDARQLSASAASKLMLRIGYPEILPVELLRDFPEGVEMIAIPDPPDREIAIDVWIPNPYANRAALAWPWLKGVRLVLSLLAGTEWIPPLVGPHVTICNARGAHNICTAEWTLAAILAMLKYFPMYYEIQREGKWKRRFEAPKHYAEITGDKRPVYPPVMLEELTGKTVLLVGHGSIGKEIERMLAPFDVHMVRVARIARSEPEVHAASELDNLLPRADVVVLILPSTDETKDLIGSRQLGLMKQGALLVNAARGPIVNTDALVEALHSGRIRAAIDVTDPEPLPEGHPLWSCPNLMITPHIGGSSKEFSPRGMRTAAGEVRRYLKGEPLENVVQAAI